MNEKYIKVSNGFIQIGDEDVLIHKLKGSNELIYTVDQANAVKSYRDYGALSPAAIIQYSHHGNYWTIWGMEEDRASLRLRWADYSNQTQDNRFRGHLIAGP